MPTRSGPGLTCPKCQGFVLTEYTETRCLNCGCRPLDRPREPEEAPQGRRRTCSNCASPAKAGHNYCQPHLDYFRAYRVRKKAQGESSVLVQPN